MISQALTAPSITIQSLSFHQNKMLESFAVAADQKRKDSKQSIPCTSGQASERNGTLFPLVKERIYTRFSQNRNTVNGSMLRFISTALPIKNDENPVIKGICTQGCIACNIFSCSEIGIEDQQEPEKLAPLQRPFEQFLLSEEDRRKSLGVDSAKKKEFTNFYEQQLQNELCFRNFFEPVTRQSCIHFFNQIAEQRSFNPLIFYFSENYLEFPCEQKDWEEVLISMPMLVKQSPSRKNWILPRENISTFCEHIKPRKSHTDDLLVSFLLSIDLLQRLDEIQIVYGPNRISLFFTAEMPYSGIVEEASNANIGQEIPAIRKSSNQYRKALTLFPEDWPNFVKLVKLPHAVQRFVESRTQILPIPSFLEED